MSTHLAQRDAGAEQAWQAALFTWRSMATTILEDLAASGQPFTADDLIFRAGLPNAQAVNRNNAVGSLFLHASKTGMIVETGRRVPSARRGNHGRRLTEWIGAI